MSSRRMQSNRFDLKRVIEENRARQVRQFARSYTESEDYGKNVSCHVNRGHAPPTAPDGMTYFDKFMS